MAVKRSEKGKGCVEVPWEGRPRGSEGVKSRGEGLLDGVHRGRRWGIPRSHSGTGLEVDQELHRQGKSVDMGPNSGNRGGTKSSSKISALSEKTRLVKTMQIVRVYQYCTWGGNCRRGRARLVDEGSVWREIWAYTPREFREEGEDPSNSEGQLFSIGEGGGGFNKRARGGHV